MPAVLGTGLFVYQMLVGLDNTLNPFFSLFLAVWSTLFSEFWRRKEFELAFRWGTLNYEAEVRASSPSGMHARTRLIHAVGWGRVGAVVVF